MPGLATDHGSFDDLQHEGEWMKDSIASGAKRPSLDLPNVDHR